VPEKYVYIDGVATFLHHTGATTLPGDPPELSRGKSILCLHGGGGNGGFFRDLITRLGEHHSPLTFDQPGHGRSGGLDSLGSVERMAAFARALSDKLGLHRPVLFGHSMGGAVALQWALEDPESVRALVLCSTGAQLPVPDEFIEATRKITEGKLRRIFRRDAYSPKTSDEVVRRGWMEDAKTDPRATYGDLLACNGWDVTDRLEEVRVPTLVIHGEDEFPVLAEQSEALASRIPNATRRVLPAAGHALPLEQPDALAGAIVEFLESVPR
jgi:pimeloyl-ACP methyl ester carboxylesterase